ERADALAERDRAHAGMLAERDRARSEVGDLVAQRLAGVERALTAEVVGRAADAAAHALELDTERKENANVVAELERKHAEEGAEMKRVHDAAQVLAKREIWARADELMKRDTVH